MMRKRGRPIVDEPRTEIYCVRLSVAERRAIRELQINFADLVRRAIADAQQEGLPKAS